MTKSEIEAKIRVLKIKLDEMRQYKRVMAEDGVKPDQADKVRESDLIVRLLRLERLLAEKEGRPFRTKGGPASKEEAVPKKRPPGRKKKGPQRQKKKKT